MLSKRGQRDTVTLTYAANRITAERDEVVSLRDAVESFKQLAEARLVDVTRAGAEAETLRGRAEKRSEACHAEMVALTKALSTLRAAIVDETLKTLADRMLADAMDHDRHEHG